MSGMNSKQYYNHPQLPLTHFTFRFTTEQPAALPTFPGSAWRGALGHALKKTVCVVRNTPCSECLLKTSCAYSYIFETPPPDNAEKMRKYNAAPHPFVLRMPVADTAGQRHYPLQMLLFGHGQRFFPYLVHALRKAGSDGIGARRQVFTLQQIQQLSPHGATTSVYSQGRLEELQPAQSPTIPAMPEAITVRFHTPLRIKQNGKNLTPDNFTFAALFGNLLRRISLLTYFHTDTPLDTDFAGLMQRAREIAIGAETLHWYDWKRYSSRQQTEMHMGGLLGTIHLNLNSMEDFWPYLWLGQWTHAGKATSMGLGAYSIEAASLPETAGEELADTMSP